MSVQPNVFLTVAASDSSAGAGLQADIKTALALDCYALSAVTAVTAQNTTAVTTVWSVPEPLLAEQLGSLYADFHFTVVKIGALGSMANAQALIVFLQQHPHLEVILDPVLQSTSGTTLLAPQALSLLQQQLLPLVDLLTPNIPEAQQLVAAKTAVDSHSLCAGLLQLGVKQVLLKGGHGASDEYCLDIYEDGQHREAFQHPRLHSNNTHGTGCTLSAAIAAYRARGKSWREAVKAAIAYCQQAIKAAQNWRLGQGHGPLQHRCR